MWTRMARNWFQCAPQIMNNVSQGTLSHPTLRESELVFAHNDFFPA